MAITRGSMTDEQRKSVALEYLKAFDNKGVTSNGGSIMDLFADDAQVFFPKWGLATGKKQIGQLFTDFGGCIKQILHDYRDFLIQRCFFYLDPDYAGLDTARYHWLSAGERDASKPMG